MKIKIDALTIETEKPVETLSFSVSAFGNVDCDNELVSKNCETGSCPVSHVKECNLLDCLDDLSWDEIDRIGKSGTARERFALGATKKDYMKNGFVAVWQIIGFDHDDLEDGSGKAPISWDMVGLYKDEAAMRKDGNSVWWNDSEIRSFLNGDFKNNVSDELAAVVKPVWKYSANRNGVMEKTADEFWIKSEQELYGRKFWSYGGEGHWYEFYAQENVHYNKKKPNGNDDWQWLRSVSADHSTYFCFVYTSGSANYGYACYSRGFAPAFCI